LANPAVHNNFIVEQLLWITPACNFSNFAIKEFMY